MGIMGINHQLEQDFFFGGCSTISPISPESQLRRFPKAA